MWVCVVYVHAEPYLCKHVSEYICVLLVEMRVHAVISVIEGFAKTIKINLQRKALPLAVGHILLAGMMILFCLYWGSYTERMLFSAI